MQCVLLNADYTYLNIVDWKRALCLVVKNKVQVLSYSERIVRGAEGLVMKVPAVIKLIKFIRAIYRARVHFNKRNVLVRDRFVCMYCGKKSRDLTVDHIIPKSRGGKSDFDNCVACCKPCNNKKGDYRPEEVGLKLVRKPKRPSNVSFIRNFIGISDHRWKPYLFAD